MLGGAHDDEDGVGDGEWFHAGDGDWTYQFGEWSLLSTTCLQQTEMRLACKDLSDRRLVVDDAGLVKVANVVAGNAKGLRKNRSVSSSSRR